MNIDSVDNKHIYPPQSVDNISKKYAENLPIHGDPAKKQGDKLEISEETKKLIPIQSKINDGFYNQDQVLKETARRISRELRAKE